MCQHLASTRLPPVTTVFKDECTQCFANWNLPSGVLVCLTCFNGGCPKHAALHAAKSGHALAVRFRRTKKATPNDEPLAKITKVAIGVEGGAQTETEANYEYELEAECLSCNVKLDRNSPQLQTHIDNILHAQSASMQVDSSSWELELTPCEHTLTLQQEPNAPALAKGSCNKCELKEGLWLCLTCGNLGCARRNYDGSGGNGHGMAHYEATKHPLVVKVGTITPEGADVHCYACDEQRIDGELAAHLAHFGIDLASSKKTEKSLAELTLEQNLNLNFNDTIEAGQKLVSLFGPRRTGLANLGNTCYMASVLQLCFHLPSFADRYFANAEKHHNECRDQHATCRECQFGKIAHGLLSGEYSQPPDPHGDTTATESQPGVAPRMFKNLIARNSIFASMGQQDAEEFFDHFCTQIERSEKGRVDPTRVFELALEQRIQCSTCSGVQYQNQQQKSLSVTIPFEQANPPLERIAGEKAEDRARREMNSVVTWNQLVESFSAPEQIDFTCERCKKRTHAVKTNRIAQFPEVLVLQARRQVFDEWLPRKVAVKLDVPQQIDLEQLRARGIQPGEQSLDAPAAPVQLRGIDEIVGMGFSNNAAIRAITATGNNGAETAMQWLFAHLEDSNINDPLPPSTGSSGASKPQIPAELVAAIVEMGFNEAQARYALGKSANNPEAALELLFTTEGVIPDEPTPAEPAAPVQRSSRYELVGFIVHLGFSLGSGHYIAFAKEQDGTWVKFNDNKVAESPVPPIDQGYMFFFANTGN